MKKTLWRWLRRGTLVLLGLVAIVLIVNGLINWRNGAQIQAKIDAMRQAGCPVTLAETIPASLAPEDNAAVYIRRARDGLERLQGEIGKLEDAENAASKSLDQERANPEALQVLQSAIDAHADVYSLLETAAACPGYALPFDPRITTAAYDQIVEVFLEDIGDNRMACRALRWRALRRLAEGNREGALADCQMNFRLARHCDHSPFLVGHLVAEALRGVTAYTTGTILRDGPVSPEAHQALDAELALFKEPDEFRRALTQERAFGLHAYRELAAGFGGGMFKPCWFTCDQLAYLDLFEALLAKPLEPYEPLGDTRTVTGAIFPLAPLTRLIVPALAASYRASVRTMAVMRSLRVLNAIQAYVERTGNSDVTIADLGLPPEATTDPYNGQPLLIKKLPEGWVVYSVFENMKDDGGDIDINSSKEQLDFGVGPCSSLGEP